MNEELIKRLRLKAEVLAGLRDATASLLTQAADALSAPEAVAHVIERRIYRGSADHKAYMTARFTDFHGQNSFELDGHRWAYRHTSFDDNGDFDLIYRHAAALSDPSHSERAVPAVPVPDGWALVPVEPTTAILRPFYECPVDELPLAWSAALAIAKAQNKAATTPAPVATEAVAQVSRKGIRLEPAELRAMMEWAGIGDGYDKDDAAPLLLWVGEMKDEEGIVTYGLNARNEEVPDEGCWLVKELPRPEVNADKPEQAEDALRSLACWLSVGGYNSEEVDAAEFEKRIREGIETIVRVEVERAKKPVAQGGGVDVEKVMALVQEYGVEMKDLGMHAAEGYALGVMEDEIEAARVLARLRALLASTAVPVGDGWMPWNQAMPVSGDTLVTIRERNGREDTGRADDFVWGRFGSGDHEIVAWKPAPAATKKDDSHEG